ncbi:MAG TPA: GNAT family N-acetyltransferase [Streptosporangiaceae bacterium]
MTIPASYRALPGEPRVRELRWYGHPVRVTMPVPAGVWQQVADTDPAVMPFQQPAWRDCVCASGEWRDTSRLYELADGRQLVLMMARRSGTPSWLAREASWPAGWGSGGLLATGGLRPEDVALVGADLARSRVLSTTVRPAFDAAPAWSAMSQQAFTIPRAVHVAHFGSSFEDYLARSLTARARSRIRATQRNAEAAGVVVTSGNSADLVQALYDVYLRWADWRAAQRNIPRHLARWRARRSEPLAKFTTVASRLGPGCRIWIAWWHGQPVAADICLFAGQTAIGWRAFTDRTAPARFRLAELLAVEVLRYTCESGYRYLELGESGGRKSLEHTKTRLGGQQHQFAEYCFERLPLSAGRMAFQRRRGQLEDWILARRTSRAAGGPTHTDTGNPALAVWPGQILVNRLRP